MARTSTVTFGAINIVTHPHSPKNYADLWHAANKAGRAVKVWGDSWGMIGTAFNVSEGRPENGIAGELYRFTNIDEGAEWLDLSRREPVSEEEADNLIDIPEYLKPNLRRIRYFFLPKEHRLVFAVAHEDAKLSPSLSVKLIEQLLGHPEFSRLAPNLSVKAEQDQSKIDYILDKLSLERLIISIEIPNGDDEGDEEDTIEAVLESQNAKKQVISLEAQKHKSLELSLRNRKLAYLAASNGFVEGTGLDSEGEKKTVQTKEFPFQMKKTLPSSVRFVDWFIERSQEIIKEILRH